MEYVYAALLIHKAGHKVDEHNLKKVLEAAGTKVDEARVKATVAALDGVNIDDAITKAAAIPAASALRSSSARCPPATTTSMYTRTSATTSR